MTTTDDDNASMKQEIEDALATGCYDAGEELWQVKGHCCSSNCESLTRVVPFQCTRCWYHCHEVCSRAVSGKPFTRFCMDCLHGVEGVPAGREFLPPEVAGLLKKAETKVKVFEMSFDFERALRARVETNESEDEDYDEDEDEDDGQKKDADEKEDEEEEEEEEHDESPENEECSGSEYDDEDEDEDDDDAYEGDTDEEQPK